MLIVCRHILDEGSFNFADMLRSLGKSYRKKKKKPKAKMIFEQTRKKEKGKTNTRFKINHKKSHKTVKTQ